MTVKELIKQLQKCPPDTPVYIQDRSAFIANECYGGAPRIFTNEDYWEGGDICENLKDGDMYMSIYQ